MANTIKLKRGLEENRSTITPENGEPIYITDKQKIYVGDGSTAGGIALSYISPDNDGDVNIDGSINVAGTYRSGADVILDPFPYDTIDGSITANGNFFSKGVSIFDNLVTVKSSTSKALGNNTDYAFIVQDTLTEPLFSVKTNGDVDIAGVINVYGDGTSYFAGDINVAGSITVAESATATMDFTAADVNVTGNLSVKGSTVLGDDSTEDTTLINGIATVKSYTTKLLGNDTDNIFEVKDTDNVDLFSVKTNGDVTIGGSLTVTENSIVSANMVAENLTLTGDLAVDGNTTLGNNAANDIVTINSKTTVKTATEKQYGNNTDIAFNVEDLIGESLFSVKTNGDVDIAGVINVYGDGTSYFAGDVSIAGSIAVEESSTVTAGFAANDLTVTGNLIVDGNTTLGDEAGSDTTTIKGITSIEGAVEKALGNNADKVFKISDSIGESLFSVGTNGDVDIAGVINVYGDGTSYFAGDVSIGGALTVSDGATVTADFTADDMTVVGNLSVQGNTTLGDDAGSDTTTIKGITVIESSTTKALGNNTDYIFNIQDTEASSLFSVKTNGDVDIAGVINVYGDGTSYFAGDVSIAGSIAVEESSTVTAGFAANDLTVTGNLIVDGNTTLGDDAGSDTTTIKGITSIEGAVEKALGNNVDKVFNISDSIGESLFSVGTNGDVDIAGVINVYGDGTSYFAGDVSIGGALTVSDGATVTADFTADDMTVVGNLSVQGNTTLGDDAGSDTTSIKGITIIESSTTKALGNNTDYIFNIQDTEAASLFSVKTNGDVDIAGVINVYGDGTSYFAGNVNVAGSITVEESSTATADFSADNLTVTGNLNVNGNTILGDSAAEDTTIINGLASIITNTSKELGDSSTIALGVLSSTNQELFTVKTNGDVDIAGVINVYGDGTSYFAGDVSIGGALTVTDGATVTADFTADNMTVTGNLNVNGNTTLGDNAGSDTTTIKGVTLIESGTSKALGNDTDDILAIKDSLGENLFNVKTNGDVDIAGVISVYGDGTSYFAGDVSIGGSITVAENSTATADFAADNMTITGNLVVDGNTTLGNEITDSIKLLGTIFPDEALGAITIQSLTTKELGVDSNNVFEIISSDSQQLFAIDEQGNADFAGVLSVRGDGTSTFSGDVSINGALTVAQDATVTADFAADNMTITGNLSVQGNTILGDDPINDTTLINGVTTIKSYTSIALGNDTDNVFVINDSLDSNLFSVKTNGDVNIGGSLTVSEDAVVTADFAAENLTLTGNLIVDGDVTLGNEITDTIKILGTIKPDETLGAITIQSNNTKAGGIEDKNVLEIFSNDNQQLFAIDEQGNADFAGVLTVRGDGTSTFNGNVSIGGSITVAQDATATADFTADNMTITGNLSVQGNTTLGDDAGIDTTLINGVTTIKTGVNKSVGSALVNAFEVKSADNLALFEVKENGDTVVGGSLTVSEDAIVTANMSGQDLTLTGNLVVNGNTTLGDNVSDNINIIGTATTTTQISTDNSNKLATTAFVQAAAGEAISSALANLHYDTISISATGNVTVDSFNTTNLQSGEYFLTVSDGSNHMTSKIVFHADNTTSTFTEYAVIGSNLGTFNLSTTSGTTTLTFNSTISTGSIKIKREII